MSHQAHVSEEKKDVVKKLVKLIDEYPIVAAVNMEDLPALQLQKMRIQLRDKVVIFMTKRRLMKIGIEKAEEKNKGIKKLEEYLKGMPALLFTKDNPFKLYKILKKNKSTAPARAGQTAPKDIVVNAGPTSFAPGPLIGELGSIGIKTGVENGKIVIKEDVVAVKKDETIEPKVAEILGRLGVEPMEIGLNLVAAYEKGDILTHDVLDIDEEKYLADIAQCSTWAFNLSVETAYLTADNTEFILQKAFMDAKCLAVEQNIVADAVVKELLGKAEAQMNALKSGLNLETPVKQEETVKEKPSAEENKEEPEQEEKAEEMSESKIPSISSQSSDKPVEEKPVEGKPAEKNKQEDKQEEKVVEGHKEMSESKIPSISSQSSDKPKQEEKKE